MFEDFYNFRDKPFQLAPNPKYLYKSEKHQKALTYLEYGLIENVGFIVLTGEVGSGKTTTAHYILGTLGEDYDVAMIANTNITPDQMIRMIQSEFEISSKSNDKAAILESLNLFFIDQYEAGKKVLLVIDEAQNLSSQALEEVRMLSNLQSENYPLLQIMLIGQPELLATLKQPSIRQFTQRVAVHYHLGTLDEKESTEYIDYRIIKAGGPANLFTPAAAEKVFELSGGVPRMINLICQAALVYGFADEATQIDQDIIRQITEDNIWVSIETKSVNPKATPLDDTLQTGDPIEWRQEIEDLKKELGNITNRFENRVAHLESLYTHLNGTSQRQLIHLLKQEQRRTIKLTQKYTALEKKYKLLKTTSGEPKKQKPKTPIISALKKRGPS